MRVTRNPFGADDLARIEDENLRDAERADEDAAANRDLAEAVEAQDPAMAKRMREAAHRLSEAAAWLRGDRDGVSDPAALEIVIERESDEPLTPAEQRELEQALEGLLGGPCPLKLARTFKGVDHDA